MFFIFLMALAAFSIAGSAAYFSVYGLANTFHGTFWSVVIMGGSLEYGKLVAASYLYRYWKTSHFFLKAYTMLGIVGLMGLTSVGIFGYLSTGYQTDALPLKQMEQQVQLLEDEKTRLITRKQQIDNQIANLPSDTSRGRVRLMKEFKDEQSQVTSRVGDLDKQVLELKTKVIQTEAHVGPISYIARAFGLPADDATKYLIYLIIFVFDPMAMALTIAMNNALRIRKEEKDALREQSHIKIHLDELDLSTPPSMVVDDPPPKQSNFVPDEIPPIDAVPPTEMPEILPIDLLHEWDDSFNEEYIEPIEDVKYLGLKENNVEVKDVKFEINLPKLETLVAETVEETPHEEIPPPVRRVRPYGGIHTDTPIETLMQQHDYYKRKLDQGDTLDNDEKWAFEAVKNALKAKGFNIYI